MNLTTDCTQLELTAERLLDMISMDIILLVPL